MSHLQDLTPQVVAPHHHPLIFLMLVIRKTQVRDLRADVKARLFTQDSKDTRRGPQEKRFEFC